MSKNISKLASEAQGWATHHVILALGVVFAVGVIVGAILT
jgi:hypothetical protein